MATFADMINGTPQMMGPGPGSGQMGQVVNPMSEQTGLDHSPPKDEADLQSRVSGWQDFMNKMQTDPVLRNTMMTVGAHLIAGPQFLGENTGSIVGRSIQNGLLTHQLGRAHEASAARATRQENRADASAQAQISSSEAAAENMRQKTAADKESMPSKKRKAELEIRSKEQQLEQAPELLRSSLDTAASIRAKNYALANRANRPAGEGSPSTFDALTAAYQRANPDITLQEATKMALEHGKKVDKDTSTMSATELKGYLYMAEDGDTPEEKAAAKAILKKALKIPTTEEVSTIPDTPITEEEFRAAAKKADANGKFKLRGKEYTLKPGVKP